MHGKPFFLQQAKSLGVIYKSYLWITRYVCNSGIPVRPERETGITPCLLDKNRAVDIFLLNASVPVKERLIFSFSLQMNFLDQDLEWWLLVTGSRKFNLVVKKAGRYFQTCYSQIAFSPVDSGRFHTPYRAMRIVSPSMYKQLVNFRKSSHTRKTGIKVYMTHHWKWRKHLGSKLTNWKIGQFPMRSAVFVT